MIMKKESTNLNNDQVMTQKQSLEAVAYDQLKMAIIKGVYPPGYQIAEELVAEQLNMSRSPVRTAIRRLQTEGFLEKRTNRRVYVTLGDYRRTLNTLYVRKALEGVAAYQASINRTEEDIQEIHRQLSRMAQYYKDDDAFKLLQMGIDVHRTIYMASKNDLLTQIGINALEQESVFSYRSLNNDSVRAERSYQEHTDILNSILSQHPDLAEQQARDHIDQLIERLQNSNQDKTADTAGLLLSR